MGLAGLIPGSQVDLSESMEGLGEPSLRLATEPEASNRV